MQTNLDWSFEDFITKKNQQTRKGASSTSSAGDVLQDVGSQKRASIPWDSIRAQVEGFGDFVEQGVVVHQDQPPACASCQALKNFGLLEKPKPR